MLLSLLAILILVIFSAFFSGSEAALFSLTPGQREELKTTRPGASHRIEQLLARPGRLLGTLLLGNLIVNTTATALLALVAMRLAEHSGGSEAAYLAVSGFIMTAVLLVFGEVAPKVITTSHPVVNSRLVAGPVALVQAVLKPLVLPLLWLGARLTPRQAEPARLSDEELHTMVEIGKQRGVIHGAEEEILSNLIDLDHRTVSEVMTPRIDIMAVPDTATVGDAIRRARELGFSRLPVYHGTKDSIIGILHVKELLAAADESASVCSLCRPPYFVPEVKRLPALLDDLRRKGSHIAIVVDEFGQTAGLATLEDLLEAVFGEIADEFDLAEELPWTKVDESSYLVDGEIDVAALNRLFHNAFRKTGHERLSGLIHDRLGRLPVKGDALRFRNLEIVVQETDGQKLEKVLVRKKS